MTRLFALAACLALVAATAAGHEIELSAWNGSALTVELDDSVSISLSTTTASNGDFVTISWSNPNAEYNDFIGIWTQFTEDEIKDSSPAPAKHRWIESSYALTGEKVAVTATSGSVSLHVVNMRHYYVVAYASGGLVNPTLKAVADKLEMANENEPVGPHIALTGTEGEMRVMWTAGACDSPQVKYGTSPSALTQTAAGKCDTYTKSDLCAAPATTYGWIDPGQLINAVMTGITAGQTYYYQVGDDTNGYTEVYSFPGTPVQSATTEVKIIAYGDMGQAPLDDMSNKLDQPAALFVNDAVRKADKDLILHFGDISYAMGYLAEWDIYFDENKNISATVPYMASMGNHEEGWSKSFFPGDDSGGECGIAFSKRHIMPPPADSGDAKSPWYSFDFGPAHIVQMSTENDFLGGSEQLQWLESDLKAFDRSKTPWLIFTGHRPMYVDSPFAPDYPAMLQKSVEPLFQTYQVDIAMWGHHHSYQRTCPANAGACVTSSPKPAAAAVNDTLADAAGASGWVSTVHMVVGTAGYHHSPLMQEEPPFIVYANNDTYGFGTIDITNSGGSTTLSWKYTDADGTVYDSFSLTRTLE